MTSATDASIWRTVVAMMRKREREVMPKSMFLMVLGIIRDLIQDTDYLSKKSDKELCEMWMKKPSDNIIYFIRDKEYNGHSIALGILRSRHSFKFDNETLREAVKLYNQDTKQAEEKYGPIACWDVSQVTNMKFMFEGCETFNADLSQWDVSSVTDMKFMFDGCKSFNADISKWDVSSVTNMGCMFGGCESFNADLSHWVVRKVTKITLMFYECKSFNADLSQWNVSSVTYMDGMFEGCKSFNSDLSDWDVSSVTDMYCMFAGCETMDKLPEWYKQ